MRLFCIGVPAIDARLSTFSSSLLGSAGCWFDELPLFSFATFELANTRPSEWRPPVTDFLGGLAVDAVQGPLAGGEVK